MAIWWGTVAIWWRGQRHLLAEYRPRPLHLQPLWQCTEQDASAHESLSAPLRMVLPQPLQVDRGAALGGTGKARVAGQGT